MRHPRAGRIITTLNLEPVFQILARSGKAICAIESEADASARNAQTGHLTKTGKNNITGRPASEFGFQSQLRFDVHRAE